MEDNKKTEDDGWMPLDDFVEIFDKKVKDKDSLEQFKKFARTFGFDGNQEVKDFIEREEIRKIKNTLDGLERE